jgi:hypothetical protein
MSIAKSTAFVSSIEDRPATLGRHPTILLVQWALALACIYMLLFSEGSRGVMGLGGVVILAFLVTNFALGRLNLPQSRSLTIGIGLVDAVLIIASLQVAGQLSVELVLLCLGIVILSVAGLRLATIAGASLAMMFTYLVIVAWTGNESPWHAGTLLRLPFLFTAAVVYAWFVELGRAQSGSSPAPATGVRARQLEAIRRCRSALQEGTSDAVENELVELERLTESLAS